MTEKQKFQIRAEALTRKAGLPADWTVHVVGTGTLLPDTWGMCMYVSHRILIRWKRDIWLTGRSTILHEVAHVLCPHHRHDTTWEQKFEELRLNQSLSL